jgi:hypothetical protein
VLLVVALYVLVILARPFTKYRAALVAAMIGGATGRARCGRAVRRT